MAILSTMVGAVLLSRAVNDERLSKAVPKSSGRGRADGVVCGRCPARIEAMTERPRGVTVEHIARHTGAVHASSAGRF